MQTASIPFGTRQESGQSELAGGSPVQMNVVVDSKGAMRRRPGIKPFRGSVANSVIDPTGIQGIYVPSSGDVYAVGAGATSKNVYMVHSFGSVKLNTVGALMGTGRPIFAETEAMLAMAAGSTISKVLFSDFSFSPLTGSPPSAASHVIFNNSRLLANSTSAFKNQVFFSDQAAGSSTVGHETWAGGTSGYFSADARPDPVVALWENSNIVYALGKTTAQIFVPDANTIYAPNLTREYGCIAPYSVVKTEQGFAWLDHMKRIVVGDGTNITPISAPIQDDLDHIENVRDCWGFRVQLGICNAMVFRFESAGRTFVYSDDNGWSQWSGWNESANTYAPLAITAYCQRPDQDVCIVGLANGMLGELDSRTWTDMGAPIKASAITGFQSRDTSKLKQTIAVRLTFKRGTSTSSTAPVALLSWRDDLGGYSEPLEVDLGTTGDRYSVVPFYGLGTYRTRQWKIEFVGTDEFELVSAQEDYEVLSM